MRIFRSKVVVALTLLLGLTTLAPVASAYYYWVFFASATGPFTPVPGRFDLTALKDSTVQFFISDSGPSTLVPGDSRTAIYSQIQQAAAVWNQVGTSALRLRFGGIETVGAVPQNIPAIDVVFDDDMPPGILAQTQPTFPADLSILAAHDSNPGATFVPLLRSRLQLRSNLASNLQASFSDAYFLTLVHEFGHALGLQHTLTSGVMSTAITRGTLKGSPLAADDIAGVSHLYPMLGYQRGTGSIAGQIAIVANGNSNGANLASVVALSATGSSNGAAVSAMTNPDGTYRIDGLPAGSYYVYVHPLPAALTGEQSPANIIAPADPQGDDFSQQSGFGTLFYPATRDWTKAQQIMVTASATNTNINISVPARSSGPAVSNMEVYGYQNGVAIAAPPLQAKTGSTLVFHANGATNSQQTQITPGLAVSVVGGGASVRDGSLRYYTEGFLQMTVDTNDASAPMPSAVAVTANNDLYVLPSAFTIVPNGPPAISSVAQTASSQGAALAVVAGTNLKAQTRILIDGSAASLQGIQDDGSLIVAVPPAPSGYTGVIEAVNPDGQTSLQALSITANGPGPAPSYTYSQQDSPSIWLELNTVAAGTDTWFMIHGINTHFADGQTTVGFGNSSLSLRRTWVLSPTLLGLNISIDANAQPGNYSVWVNTGLEQVQGPGLLTVLAPLSTGPLTMVLPIINAATGLAGVPAGGTALIGTRGLGSNVDAQHGWSVAIQGENVAFSTDASGVIAVQIPYDMPIGPRLVQMNSPSSGALAAVYVQIDSPPPLIAGIAVEAADGSFHGITSDSPAHPGDKLVAWLIYLADVNGVYPPQSSLYVNFGAVSSSANSSTSPADSSHVGINYPVLSLFQASKDTPGLYVTEFMLPSDFTIDPSAPAQVPISAGTSTRLSPPFSINIAPVPAPAPAQ